MAVAELTMLAKGKNVTRPDYSLLYQAYKDYSNGRTKPCKVTKNSCAVRLSLAMFRCGVDFRKDKGGMNLHPWKKYPDKCGLYIVEDEERFVPPHAPRARELAKYLRRRFGKPLIFKGKRGELGNVVNDARVKNIGGIVYFDNLDGKTMDHIDLWDGKQYGNVFVRAGDGPRATSGKTYFDRTDEVWFFSLATSSV